MESDELDFRNYDEPERAQEIWDSYQERLEANNLIPAAIQIARKSEFADDLYVKLDNLLEQSLESSDKRHKPSGLSIDGVF